MTISRQNASPCRGRRALVGTASLVASSIALLRRYDGITFAPRLRAFKTGCAEGYRATNPIHGFQLEFGGSLPKGEAAVKRLASVLAEHPLPPRLIAVLERLHAHIKYLNEELDEIREEVARQLASDDLGQRLLTIPGVGPVTASVLTAEMGDGKQYGCSQDFAVSLGLVPGQYSTGGRSNLSGVSKRGDKYLRWLLVQCARAVMRRLDRQCGPRADWARSMLTRRRPNVVACALGNKLVRVAWALAAHIRPSTSDRLFCKPDRLPTITEFHPGQLIWFCDC
ncbi:transposase IS116/IS110/IS902 family protein [Paraburkholderia sp. BL6669N2]|nr:transposase IS116/IS110/IS902 family protein [Paraburkholderia sp. BL6669N2]